MSIVVKNRKKETQRIEAKNAIKNHIELKLKYCNNENTIGRVGMKLTLM
jgi:hypothetical protein